MVTDCGGDLVHDDDDDDDDDDADDVDVADAGGDLVGEGDDLPLDGEHPRRGDQAVGGEGGEGGD